MDEDLMILIIGECLIGNNICFMAGGMKLIYMRYMLKKEKKNGNKSNKKKD